MDLLHALGAGLDLLLQVDVMVLIALGTAIGICVGAIPGLTATMAIAMAVPITYTLDAMQGLALLIAVYVGGLTGGLVSAILLNIPGTPSSIATTFDGWGRLSSMRLSQSVRRNEQELTHMTCQRHAFALAPVVEAEGPQPCAMIYGHTAAGTDPLYDQRWRGPWISRRWWPHAITNATPMED